MWNPPRATIIHGIITLDKEWLIRPLSILKVPSMIRVRPDCVRLALAVWIDQCGGNEVAVWHGMGVCKTEWISEDGLDGTPNL
jgi:hypothetical protein